MEKTITLLFMFPMKTLWLIVIEHRQSFGANWKQPKGKGSTIDGKDNHPVVHVSYEDAMAYCN